MKHPGRFIRRFTPLGLRLPVSRYYYPKISGRMKILKKRPKELRLDPPQKYNHSKSVVQPKLHGYTFWK